MTIWFTSDWHIGHHNIIGFCKRPFADVDAMNGALIRNFNAVVQPGDQVFFLGDFSFCDPRPWVSKLNGEKFLIAGNHDQSRMQDHKRAGWGWIKDIFELKTDFNRIVLCHYPLRSWNGSFHGSWHLFGHTHGLLPDTDQSLDVGADKRNFRPISLEEVAQKLRDPKVTSMMEPELRYRLAKAPAPHEPPNVP